MREAFGPDVEMEAYLVPAGARGDEDRVICRYEGVVTDGHAARTDGILPGPAPEGVCARSGLDTPYPRWIAIMTGRLAFMTDLPD